MRRYIRARQSGATWFFTVNLAERCGNRLLIDRIVELREAFRATHRDHPFATEAIVILPDHLHAIWTLPEGDADFSLRWSLIKARFSRSIATGERVSLSRQRRRERGLWQRRFWEHSIRDEDDLAAHIDYVHVNPVKHGYAARTVDWRWSSFHRYVRDGRLPSDWSDPPAEDNP